jgi:hypothetical protein
MVDSSVITAAEFEQQYAERSNMTIEQLREWREPAPCDCGDELCRGWQMVSAKDKQYWGAVFGGDQEKVAEIMGISAAGGENG